MPRYRGTREGAAALVGRLLLLIASGQETSTTLARKLGVSQRQVNRYITQLIEAGWQIEREGAKKLGDVKVVLKSPKIVMDDPPKKRLKRRKKSRGY